MGIFKELTQALKNDPWIPMSKKSSKAAVKAAATAAQPKIAKKTKSFCDPNSSKPCVTVCVPREGCSCECDAIRQALVDQIQQEGLNIKVGNAKMGCSGTCTNGPFIGFPQKGFFYLKVQKQDVPEIVKETLTNGRILFPLVSINPEQSFRSDVYYERDTGFIGVIDEQISMVEVAKYFLDFEEGLSCGKCTPCRIGIKRLSECLERIVSGEGTTEDLAEVRMLCETMRDAPYCDFASTSSQPVLSAVTYFESEFRAVVKEVPPPAEPAKERGAEKKKASLEAEPKKAAVAEEVEAGPVAEPVQAAEPVKEPQEKTVAKAAPETVQISVPVEAVIIEEKIHEAPAAEEAKVVIEEVAVAPAVGPLEVSAEAEIPAAEQVPTARVEITPEEASLVAEEVVTPPEEVKIEKEWVSEPEASVAEAPVSEEAAAAGGEAPEVEISPELPVETILEGAELSVEKAPPVEEILEAGIALEVEEVAAAEEVPPVEAGEELKAEQVPEVEKKPAKKTAKKPRATKSKAKAEKEKSAGKKKKKGSTSSKK
jgi:(2Fe-2S) ferredoxin